MSRKAFTIPWKAWYGPELLEMTFPAEWDVAVFAMKDSPCLSDAEISEAIRKPHGTVPLSRLARGKATAAIAVDDLTRPTEGGRIIPVLIDELEAAGIRPENILIVVALGGHRAMSRQDLLRKFGSHIVERFTIYNHSPFYNLTSYGVSSRGTPIFINSFFAEAEVKIGVGSIVPHPDAGFGGGAKIVLPGVAGADTILKNHTPTLGGDVGGILEVEQNENRADIEEVARKVGLDFIVNQVPNALGQAAGIFAGDFIEAHREGVSFAKDVYATPRPREALDVAVVSAFPMDIDLVQIDKALNVFRPCHEHPVKPGGTIVIIAACPEGRGYHAFGDYKLPLWQTIEKNPHTGRAVSGRHLMIFSPCLRQRDVEDYYPPGTLLCNTWEQVESTLGTLYKDGGRLGIFPAAGLQILDGQFAKATRSESALESPRAF